MANPIFAMPRTIYGSYTDLEALVRLSGFERIFIDEIDPASDNTYVVTVRNGESEPGWPGARADIRLLDLEWRQSFMPNPPGVRETWYADKWLAGVAGGKYVPLGSHSDLSRFRGQVEAVIMPHTDVAYIGYLEPPRRASIASQLRDRGVNAHINNNCWGSWRHMILSNTRSYLCVHQLDNAPGIPILRMVVAAAYSLPVIMENCADPGIFANLLLTSDYAHLADFTAMWARDKHTQVLDDKAWALHELLCNRLTFRKSIEGAM